MLHHCFTQPTKWTKNQMDWLTCWPVGRSLSTFEKIKIQRSKPKQGIGFTSNDPHSYSIYRLPPALPGPPAPASGVQRRCFARLTTKCYPADSQAIPPLCTSCYSLLSVGPPHTRTNQVSHSSPSMLHCRVFPISRSFQSGASPSSTTSLRSARCGQQTRVIGRGLYMRA